MHDENIQKRKKVPSLKKWPRKRELTRLPAFYSTCPQCVLVGFGRKTWPQRQSVLAVRCRSPFSIFLPKKEKKNSGTVWWWSARKFLRKTDRRGDKGDKGQRDRAEDRNGDLSLSYHFLILVKPRLPPSISISVSHSVHFPSTDASHYFAVSDSAHDLAPGVIILRCCGDYEHDNCR